MRMGQQWAVGVPLGEGLHANDTGELSTQKPGGHTKALKYAQFWVAWFLHVHTETRLGVYNSVNILKMNCLL